MTMTAKGVREWRSISGEVMECLSGRSGRELLSPSHISDDAPDVRFP